MNSLIRIADVSIRQDAEGRYCLNDLHRAAGDEARHKPGNWLMLDQTKALTAEIEIAGNPAIQSKQGLGTFVAKELVYAYAMWISPAFHLKVIRAYDALVSGQQVALAASAFYARLPKTLPEALRLAADESERADEAEAKLAEAQPKVDGFERIAKSDGSLCITDAAKTLQVQPRRLTQLLQEKGWIYRRPMGSGWLAYQDRIQSGHMEHKVTTGEKSDGREWSNTQPRITPKGLNRLTEVIRQEGLH